ncbi:hypothetical protein KSW81_000683 [Nannochloris sp. 'desiccata']|nr:hypothetical protein KSW81_000683 [Chlorella desiccata (nom. nud.)]
MEVIPSCCAYNYVVTAHKPTSVSHSAVGHFTAPEDLNLIISKSTRLEIHKLTPQGLQGCLDVPIFGRISVVKLFRPRGERKDLLFLLTERYRFCVLEFNEAKRELITRAHGDVADKVGRPCEAGQIGIIDPDCRLIGLHLYDGHFKIIPIVDGALQEAFNVRLDELKVLDLAFLHGCAVPTLAVLFEDTKEQRHIKTYQVSVKDKELRDGPWSEACLDSGSSLVVPVRNTSGAVVIGEQAAIYLSDSSVCSASIKPTMVKAFASVGDDGSRYLLGDYLGNLFLLVLEGSDGLVNTLKLEPLGKTSQASTLSYLDNGFVFVGSCFGDSQLVRLHAQPVEGSSPDNYVEVLDTMTNLGPIVDFCVVDLDRQGQGQVVTCSGGGADGSLRIIRNGIGFLEQASVELPGMKGIWSLRKNYADAYDTYLVMAFVGETRVLGMNADDELDEADISGFDSAAQTLWCGNMLHDQIVQVTDKELRILNAETKQAVSNWAPPEGKRIIVVNGNASQVCVATNAGNVVLLRVENGSVVEVGHTKIEGEVSCLDLSPIGANSDSANLLTIGTWSMKIHLLSLPDLQVIGSHDLGGEVMPRSVLLATFEDKPYLLCGLGDGTLLSYHIEEGLLTNRKKLALGTKPITLREFKARGMSHAMMGIQDPKDSVRLLDDQTFETLDVFKLNVYEMACSVSSMKLSDDTAEYFAVGTALAPPEELEPTKGRILLFQVHNGKLQLISQKETRGAVYNLNPFHGKLLAGINSRVQLYKWEQQDDGSRQLVPECSHAGHVLVLFVDVRGDFILIGDLMKSMQLLLYKPDENKLELRARDYNPSWMSAATFLDNDVYLGAENNYNLYTVRKNDEVAEEEMRSRLQVVGGYHLGDFVNRFQSGSLVMRMPDSALSNVPTKIYGSISGAVGVIASIGAEHYEMLAKVQIALTKVISGVGGLEHKEYRSFQTPFSKNTAASQGFIDGDLVEQILDLPVEGRDAVFAELKGEIDPETVLQFVEELSRTLH